MQEEQLENVYLLVVKPDTVWEEKADDGYYSIIPTSDKKATAIIMDLDEEHHVVDLEKFQVYNVPERFKEFKVKNASKEHKSYIILKKGLINE